MVLLVYIRFQDFVGSITVVPQDILDDVLPDPDDLADFELPDQQALIDAFLDGLCKESDHEFRGLSHLLASLPS
jgi:hypothetical protein